MRMFLTPAFLRSRATGRERRKGINSMPLVSDPFTSSAGLFLPRAREGRTRRVKEDPFSAGFNLIRTVSFPLPVFLARALRGKKRRKRRSGLEKEKREET